MEKLIFVLIGSVIVAVFVVAFALLFAVVTQWAWAGSIAQIFHLPELTWSQAFWLNVLGGMVCKGSSGSSK